MSESVFVTVGSTRFDLLVQAVLSTPVLSTLAVKGYRKLVIQRGKSQIDAELSDSPDGVLSLEKDGIAIEIWRFKPSLDEQYRRADLVISHAGSGTILDVLRLGKSLIVVPNGTLLDNHQEDLASALTALGYLKACTVTDLPRVISQLDPSAFTPFPSFDGNKFRNILDEEMGFV